MSKRNETIINGTTYVLDDYGQMFSIRNGRYKKIETESIKDNSEASDAFHELYRNIALNGKS